MADGQGMLSLRSLTSKKDRSLYIRELRRVLEIILFFSPQFYMDKEPETRRG